MNETNWRWQQRRTTWRWLVGRLLLLPRGDAKDVNFKFENLPASLLRKPKPTIDLWGNGLRSKELTSCSLLDVAAGAGSLDVTKASSSSTTRSLRARR